MARTAEPSVQPDVEVLDMVRRGDLSAYVVLYERHVGAARRLARSLLHNTVDADDVVSEVFASVLGVIQRGKGPHEGFTAYLMASIRHECYRARRQNGRTTQIAAVEGGFGASDDRGVEVDPFARRDEAEVLHQALQSLPPRSREVLWRTEVEGQSHQEIAELIGSTPQAVAAQALRARRALGGAYLQGHLAATGESLPPACGDARRHLAELVRESVSSRRRRRLDSHLKGCPACRQACDGLRRLNKHLRTAPGMPIAAAVGLKARFLGWLAASSTPLVAATGLVVVSTVVPLVVTQRADGDERVATVEVAGDEAAGDDMAGTTAVSVRVQPSDDPVTTARPTDDERRERNARNDDAARRTTTTSVARTPKAAEPRPERRDSATTTAPPAAQAPESPPPPATPPPAEPPPAAEPPIASTPNVTVLPPVSLPPISLPAIEVPGITTPAVSLPPVSLPLITVPSVTVPSLSIPAITVPSITVPSITLPPITVPSITIPPITLPPIGG